MRIPVLLSVALAGCAGGARLDLSEEREIVERYLGASRLYAETTERGATSYTSILRFDERFFFLVLLSEEKEVFAVEASGDRMKVRQGGRVDEGAATPLFYRAMRAMALTLPLLELPKAFGEGIPDQGACEAIERTYAGKKAVRDGGGWSISTDLETVTFRIDAAAKAVAERTLRRQDDHHVAEIRERFDRLHVGTSRND